MKSPAETHILFFGDSHTVGVGDPSILGWVGRVVAASHAAGKPLTAYNLGVRGQTSKDVLERWRDEAGVRLSEIETRVVFAVGANDTTAGDDGVRCDADESVETLTALLSQAAAIGLPTMVVGPAPVGDERQMQRIAELSERFAKVCEEAGVPYVEVASILCGSEVWRREIAVSDEAHPASAGYEELARIVLESGWLGWVAR